MTTTNDTTCLPMRYTLPLFLFLTAAGLAGNWFEYSLFLNVDFLFGSVFAMLALQFLGLGRAVLAGFLISSVTYQLLNHPYDIITMTTEVAVVGWLYQRRDMNIVVADTFYWCLIGMPLTYLFFHQFMHVPLNGIAIVAIKHTVNGICNTLLARLLFTSWGIIRHRLDISLQELAFNLLTLFVLVPSLALLILSGKTASQDTEIRVRTHLEQTNRNVTQRLRVWFENRLPTIAYLADLAETLPPAAMQDHLDRMRAVDPNFLRLGLHDANGIAIAYSPVVDELGKRTIGLNFADRPYLAALRQPLKPALSEVMPGRIGRSTPIVALLSPVVVNNQFHGYVGGALDLRHLQDYLARAIDGQGMQYALLDTERNVVLANHPGQQIMTPFSHGRGELKRLDGALSQWVPALPPNVPSMERWRKSFYVVESAIPGLSGWTIILDQPIAPFQKKLDKDYSTRLFEIFGVLLAALALAQLLSRTVHHSLELLQKVSADLPQKIGLGESIVWPESGIKEANRMIANFREVAIALDRKFGEIRQMNLTLEQRVAERTQELQESEERYRELFQAESDAILLTDRTNGRLLEANNAAAALYGYRREELLTMLHTDLSAEPEKTKKVTQEGEVIPGQILTVPLHFHRKKDGTVFPVEITARYFIQKGRFVHLAAIRDISIRMQNELALRESEERFRTLFQHIPAVAVQGYDLDGTTHYWNDASEKIYGYTAREAIGLNLLDLVVPLARRHKARQAIDRMAESGQPIPPAELSLMRKNGSRVTVYSSHAILQRSGDRPEFFRLDIDLTERKQAEEQTLRALKEKEVLLQEVHHRVKNNMQVVHSMLNLQARGLIDPKVRALFEETQNRVNAMALIHEKLYRSADLSSIDFNEYLNHLVIGITKTYNRPEVTVSVEVDGPIALDVHTGIPCGLIVNELVSNSLKHAFPERRPGAIRVGLNRQGNKSCVLSVIDNGIGLPDDLDFKNSTSLGLQLVTVLSGQLHGTIQSTNAAGTIFSLTFPAPQT